MRLWWTALLFWAGLAGAAWGAPPMPKEEAPARVLNEAQWGRVDKANSRALAWLATQQGESGAFHSLDNGQPAVTSLCIMAFLACGHHPGEGPYGEQLNKAIDFVISCQKPKGILEMISPQPGDPELRWITGMYNHGISGTMLAEVYGTTTAERSAAIRTAIERAIGLTVHAARVSKPMPFKGGWRYTPMHLDADMSISSWQLMFLRSAHNAGFDVPEDVIDGAVDFIKRCYNLRGEGAFSYAPDSGTTPAMNGAGIVGMALSGLHQTEMAQSSAKYLVVNYMKEFTEYNICTRYHYNIYHTTLGLMQIGGETWRTFYPPVVEVLLKNQGADGSWQAETQPYDSLFGNAYTTALIVQALAAPNQLIPIYQR